MEVGEIVLVDLTLRVGLGFIVGMQQMGVFRAGRGFAMLVCGFLHQVPFIVELMGLLKLTLRVAVFLKPPWEGMVQYGWSSVIRGSWKVMHLMVFLKLPGIGEVGTLRVFIWECATKFGTFQDP